MYKLKIVKIVKIILAFKFLFYLINCSSFPPPLVYLRCSSPLYNWLYLPILGLFLVDRCLFRKYNFTRGFFSNRFLPFNLFSTDWNMLIFPSWFIYLVMLQIFCSCRFFFVNFIFRKKILLAEIYSRRKIFWVFFLKKETFPFWFLLKEDFLSPNWIGWNEMFCGI